MEKLEAGSEYISKEEPEKRSRRWKSVEYMMYGNGKMMEEKVWKYGSCIWK